MTESNMKTWLGEVSRFCQDVVDLGAPDKPAVLSDKRAAFFAGVVNEELTEFLDANARKDVGGAADAIVDLIYFALGRLYEMGVPADMVFDDVHRANMTKVRGRKRREVRDDDDAVKPEGWRAPDHSWLAHLSYVAVEAAKVRATKAGDYRNPSSSVTLADYFPFGIVSHAQMIWTKALRIRALLETGKEPNHESLRDSLVDLHNYVDFAIEDLDGNLERGGP